MTVCKNWIEVVTEQENGEKETLLAKSTNRSARDIIDDAIYGLYELESNWKTAQTKVINEKDALNILSLEPSIRIINSHAFPHQVNINDENSSQVLSA